MPKMQHISRYKYYHIAIFSIATILCACGGACALEPPNSSFGNVTVVGRNPTSSQQAADTPSQVTETAKVIIRLSTSSVMKISSSEAENILETKVMPLCKSFKFVRGVYWDKSNASLIITVDTREISAEDAGVKLRDALSSKLGMTIIDVGVRR